MVPWAVLTTFPQMLLCPVWVLITFERLLDFALPGLAALPDFLETTSPRPFILPLGIAKVAT